MLKRYVIIALLSLAYSLVLGHSVIPHHHHDNDHLTEQATHNHNDHDDDESDMEHAFENYVHADGDDNNYHQPVSKNPVQQIASAYLICNFNIEIKQVESPPPVVQCSGDYIPIIHYSHCPKGLRAPPFCLV